MTGKILHKVTSGYKVVTLQKGFYDVELHGANGDSFETTYYTYIGNTSIPHKAVGKGGVGGLTKGILIVNEKVTLSLVKDNNAHGGAGQSVSLRMGRITGSLSDDSVRNVTLLVAGGVEKELMLTVIILLMMVVLAEASQEEVVEVLKLPEVRKPTTSSGSKDSAMAVKDMEVTVLMAVAGLTTTEELDEAVADGGEEDAATVILLLILSLTIATLVEEAQGTSRRSTLTYSLSVLPRLVSRSTQTVQSLSESLRYS